MRRWNGDFETVEFETKKSQKFQYSKPSIWQIPHRYRSANKILIKKKSVEKSIKQISTYLLLLGWARKRSIEKKFTEI